jgi:hypothetical protein
MIELATKHCEFIECQCVMTRGHYPTKRAFELARFCSSACNHRSRSLCDWQAIMAFEVTEGVELTCAEIGKIGHVSKQACQQIVDGALEQLKLDPCMQLLALAASDLPLAEWWCSR